MKAIILCNVGTPQSPSPHDVQTYLREFLCDKYVISIPQPFRSLLVNKIIIPRRLVQSTERYRQLTTLYNGEMPLRKYMNDLVEAMQKQTAEWDVFGYLQYGGEQPEELVRRLKSKKTDTPKLSYCPYFHTKHTVPTYRHHTNYSAGFAEC